MKINVVDESHDYSLLLRYNAMDIFNNMAKAVYWFDIVDNTEMDF